MEFGLGALLGMSGINALSGLASSGIQYLANKNLQENAQVFNANEAVLNREFQAREAQINRIWQGLEANNARQWQHDEARISREWNLNLENTKYQRMINDLKSAGINPAAIGMTSAGSPVSSGVPSASQVGGVSTPSGSAASSGSSSISAPNFGNLITSAFNIALTNSFQNERFAKELTQRTAYEAQKIAVAEEANRARMMHARAHLTDSTDRHWRTIMMNAKKFGR